MIAKEIGDFRAMSEGRARVEKQNTRSFGGDALGGNTRSHPEHDG